MTTPGSWEIVVPDGPNLQPFLEAQQLAFGDRCWAALLLAHGRAFQTKPRPGRLGLGYAKQCFRNATEVARHSANGRFAYVEGYAVGTVPIPVEHAWVVDTRDGLACEITWPLTGREYWGVQFDRDWLVEVVRSQPHYGVVERFAAEAFRGESNWKGEQRGDIT